MSLAFWATSASCTRERIREEGPAEVHEKSSKVGSRFEEPSERKMMRSLTVKEMRLWILFRTGDSYGRARSFMGLMECAFSLGRLITYVFILYIRPVQSTEA
jgi:hypothetical protein